MKKNIVITGGTSGVGLAIARDLDDGENEIMIVGRSREHGLESLNSLSNQVHFFQADLTLDSDIEELRNIIVEKFARVDSLILSAGVMPKNTKENIAVNLVSHYRVAIELAPLLNNGRVLLVSGNPRAVTTMPICESQSTRMEVAGWIVTHKTLLMIYLANELRSRNISVNTFFPGDVRSNLMPYTRDLLKTDVLIGKYLVLDQNIEGVTGKFFDENGAEVTMNPKKYNYKKAQEVLASYLPI
ncbi:SDR family NAD(P)-dependent oxidoreductase [Eupransor demetentiae]|uniref:Short-chain dehydrogenase (YqjQ) n=1 Tax=Eupransor demetentiae TaxID=3109584 RepID=A0ABP0EPX4_9LACO|nr:Short-chain dehydrogenase (YqjQ) [Lactobacillaceae bacterium LMG 33000]